MPTPNTWNDPAVRARLARFAWPQDPKIRGAEEPENLPPLEDSLCPCCGTLLCEHGYPGDRYCPRCAL